MAQPTLRQLIRHRLVSNNKRLRAAHVQLEPYQNNTDAKALRDSLLQQAQQNAHAIKLFNVKDTDGAIEAMPKEEVVQHICREADTLLDQYTEDIPTDEDEPDSESDASNDHEDEDSSPETETQPTPSPEPRPMSARDMRQQSPDPTNDNSQAIKYELKSLVDKGWDEMSTEERRRFKQLLKQFKSSNGKQPSWLQSFLGEHSLTSESIEQAKSDVSR